MILTRTERVVCYLLVSVFTIFLLAPVVWMLSTSFKNQLDIFSQPPRLIADVTLANYRAVLTDPQFTRAFMNSVIVSTGTVLVSVIFAIPAAYGLSHVTGGRRAGLLAWVLLVRAAPGMIYVIPYYLAYRGLGMIDTYTGLILVNAVFTIPLAIWIMIPFFDAIPREIEEAGIIDGATRLQTMFRISIPLAAPGIASTAILVFIFSWNEFLFALTLTRFKAKTAAISILNYMAFEGTEWGKVAAAGTLILLPVLCFSIMIRKYLVQTTAGGVKG